MLTIIFFGLIVHVNQPFSWANTAVIPYSAQHTALIHIPEGALQYPNDAFVKSRGTYDANSKEYQILLDGFVIKVKGTRGVLSNLDQELVDSEPPLAKLAPTCRLRLDVRTRTTHPNDLISFIDYRGGRLTTVSYFPNQLKFPKSTDATLRDGICVDCKVQYEADLKGETATLNFTDTTGTHDVVIKADSTLTVTNLLPDGVHLDHFDAHFRIFENCTPMKFLPGNPCKDKEYCKEATVSTLLHPKPPFPDADCTNSHFP